jgi:D-alanyl-D-alanine carboxypeptidase
MSRQNCQVKPLARVLLPVVLALISFTSLGAQSVKPPDHFDREQIDSYLATEVLSSGRVGLAVALVKNGKVALVKGYGQASIQGNVPVDRDTLFAIGSITKQFTCACVLLLAQDGKLSVQDKVSHYFPKLTRADSITVLDLMNHTSGYPDYYPLDFVDRRMQKPISPDELIGQYAGGKLDFEPGTAWSYSNTGFIILGRIVEKASGQAFGDFLAERILKPLGLAHTAYEPDPKDRRLTTGYTSFALSDPEAATPEAKGWIGAAGALYSTPGDLAEWDLALMEGKVLRPEFHKLMTTAREISSGKTTGYACGLAVGMQEGRVVLRHSGAVSGFNAYNAFVPSTRSAVVVLCNKEGGLGSLPDKLLELLLKDGSHVPTVSGLTAAEAVKAVFAQFQSDQVDRAQFGEEFNVFLTDDKITGACRRLKGLGVPRETTVIRTSERGGLEVTTTRLNFAEKALQVLMYRTPQGRIEQFFIDEP